MVGIPEVRALCTRARRPVMRLFFGSTLILPAILLGARPYENPIDNRTDESTEAVQADATHAARTAVQAAWRAKLLERERERVSLKYADRFGISLSLAHEIHMAAIEAEVDPELAFGLVRAESSFRPKAVSPVGAVGLTQLMPSTAEWVRPGTSRSQLFDPRLNLRVGFRYLRMLLDQYEDPKLALTAYNRGPGTVDRLLESGADPDNGYTKFVKTGDAAEHVRALKTRRSWRDLGKRAAG